MTINATFVFSAASWIALGIFYVVGKRRADQKAIDDWHRAFTHFRENDSQ